MSFKQRIITPIFVSRVEVGKGANDELEWVSNHTMANIILQLSSLSRLAEDLFSDLSRSTVALNQRTTNLSTKITKIEEKVAQLDATEEEILLHDLHTRNQFKSTEQHDQQVVSRITMSTAIQDLYNMCARPPPLDKLNMYRDDDMDCMKFYTDPSYFFQLWLLSIQQDIEKKKELKKKKGKARKQKRNVQVKPKDVTSVRERNKHKGMGAEFIDDIAPKQPKHDATPKPAELKQQEPIVNGDLPPPSDIDLPPPNDLNLPPPLTDDMNYPPPPPVMTQYNPDDDLPPPPPPPLDEGQPVPPPPPPLMTSPGTSRPVAPPPPPPLVENGVAPPPPPPVVANTNPEPQKVQASQKPDRGDLLSQIREGNKTLKKMEERKHQEKPKPTQDVHSMMTQLFVARRQALEDTDSDDDGDYDDDDDDDEWD